MGYITTGNTVTIDTYITDKGKKGILSNRNLLNQIKYFSLGDSDYNYYLDKEVDYNDVRIPDLTGLKDTCIPKISKGVGDTFIRYKLLNSSEGNEEVTTELKKEVRFYSNEFSNDLGKNEITVVVHLNNIFKNLLYYTSNLSPTDSLVNSSTYINGDFYNEFLDQKLRLPVIDLFDSANLVDYNLDSNGNEELVNIQPLFGLISRENLTQNKINFLTSDVNLLTINDLFNNNVFPNVRYFLGGINNNSSVSPYFNNFYNFYNTQFSFLPRWRFGSMYMNIPNPDNTIIENDIIGNEFINFISAGVKRVFSREIINNKNYLFVGINEPQNIPVISNIEDTFICLEMSYVENNEIKRKFYSLRNVIDDITSFLPENQSLVMRPTNFIYRAFEKTITRDYIDTTINSIKNPTQNDNRYPVFNEISNGVYENNSFITYRQSFINEEYDSGKVNIVMRFEDNVETISPDLPFISYI